jgi:LuxR family maltose regulon positive regulatory protein
MDQCAWLSLDEDDNDPVRFFTYLSAACEKIEGMCHSIQPHLYAPQPASPKLLSAALINDSIHVSRPFALVLDDYRLISDKSVHQALTYLLQNIPPQMNLIIASRTDPICPISRLRARGQTTEIRTDELRFTAEEVADFLEQRIGLTLTASDVKALETPYRRVGRRRSDGCPLDARAQRTA